MATYTSNYGWTKPSGSDNVDISVLNDNLDDQDSTIHDAFLNMAPPFSESSTYAVDDIVLHGTGLYKCHTAVVTPGSWTGSTNWQVYKLSEGGSGGGGTSNYNDLTNKPSINGVTLTGNKTTSDLSLQDKMQYSTMPTASAENEGKIYQYVGTTDANYTNGYYYKCVENNASYSWQLVENIKEQTPTFSQASTRNNIASGEKLSVILGKIQKFFNDLKTVAFSGSYSDLTNQPQINSNTLSGNKTTSDLGINADNVMMSDGVTSVEDAVGEIKTLSVRLKSQSGVSVTANTPAVTTIDWTGIDKSKVLASWVWWSNSASDTPASTPVIYYELTDNVGCVKKVSHQWTVNQTVNLKVVYIYME